MILPVDLVVVIAWAVVGTDTALRMPAQQIGRAMVVYLAIIAGLACFVGLT